MEILKALKNSLQEITAPVLVPNTVDYHGDTASPEEIRKACRNFNDNCLQGNLQHGLQVSNDTMKFVESYITPAPMMVKSKDGSEDIVYPTGTWMLTAHIKNKDLWQDVEDGKYTGFSVGCDALCQRIEKARLAGQTTEKLRRQLFDFDFSHGDAHVALVDEAANGTKIAIFKSTEKQDIDMDEKLELEMLRKEKADREAAAAQVEIEKAQKAAEEAANLAKAKEASDKEIAELKKAKEDADKELAELRKEKEEKVKAGFIAKAKELKADDADVFGVILHKCSKALDAEEFEALEGQLNKLSNIEKNADKLDNVGEGSTRKSVIKSADQKLTDKADEFMKEDNKLSRLDALQKSREFFKNNDREVYDEAMFGKSK
jgi:hypothetical protein